MIDKKDKKGKCPFRRLKECSDECILYRKGVRFNEQRNESYPFEACALNIIADNLEAMHNRTFMLQKEVGETKNVMSLKVLADLGLVHRAEVERQAKKMMKLQTADDLVIEDSKKDKPKQIEE